MTSRRAPATSSANVTPAASSTTSPAARTWAFSARPYVMTRPLASRAIPATHGSSAFSATQPSGGIARTSDAFSTRTPSSEPRNSVCTAATVVTTPIVGRASSARYAISPGRLVPSSSTSAWCSGASRRSVSGRPHWLLKLPAGLSTLKRVASTAATSSLVVVLPLDPVTATTGTAKRAR